MTALNRSRLASLNTCEVIFSVLQRHVRTTGSSSPECSRRVCLAIVNSSFGEEKVAEKFGSVGVCRLLPTILTTHNENLQVIEQACRAIVNLTYGSSNNQARFGTHNACEALVRVLKHKIKVLRNARQGGSISINGEYGDSFHPSAAETDVDVDDAIEAEMQASNGVALEKPGLNVAEKLGKGKLSKEKVLNQGIVLAATAVEQACAAVYNLALVTFLRILTQY